MTPLFYEDSLGARLAQNAHAWLESLGSADDELVDDARTLDTAQREANGEDPEAVYAEIGNDWVPIFGPSKLSRLWDVAGWSASKITMPLVAEGIAFAWDPYPPEEMPGSATPFYHLLDRPFTLLVAPADADAARELISALPGADTQFGLPAVSDGEDFSAASRPGLAWALVLIALGISIATGIGLYALR